MLVFTDFTEYTILFVKTRQDTYFLKMHKKELLRKVLIYCGIY